MSSRSKVFSILEIFIFILLFGCGSEKTKREAEDYYNLKKAHYEVKKVSKDIEHLRQLFNINYSNADEVKYYLERCLGAKYRTIIDSRPLCELDFKELQNLLNTDTYLDRISRVDEFFPQNINEQTASARKIKENLSDFFSPIKETLHCLMRSTKDNQEGSSNYINRFVEKGSKVFSDKICDSLKTIDVPLAEMANILSANYAKFVPDEEDPSDGKVMPDISAIKAKIGSFYLNDRDINASEPNSPIYCFSLLVGVENLHNIYNTSSGRELIIKSIEGYENMDNLKYKPSINAALEISLDCIAQNLATNVNRINGLARRVDSNIFYSKLKSEFYAKIENYDGLSFTIAFETILKEKSKTIRDYVEV